MFNILRVALLVVGPVAGYFLGNHSHQGVLVGLGFAAIIIAVELLFERIQLVTLFFGAIGAVVGLIIGRILFAMVLRLDEPTLHNIFSAYSGNERKRLG